MHYIEGYGRVCVLRCRAAVRDIRSSRCQSCCCIVNLVLLDSRRIHVPTMPALYGTARRNGE